MSWRNPFLRADLSQNKLKYLSSAQKHTDHRQRKRKRAQITNNGRGTGKPKRNHKDQSDCRVLI